MEAQKAAAVDMWTSVNSEAYLALTCHYIHANMQLCTYALGVQHFLQSHAADRPKSNGARWKTGPPKPDCIHKTSPYLAFWQLALHTL